MANISWIFRNKKNLKNLIDLTYIMLMKLNSCWSSNEHSTTDHKFSLRIISFFDMYKNLFHVQTSIIVQFHHNSFLVFISQITIHIKWRYFLHMTGYKPNIHCPRYVEQFLPFGFFILLSSDFQIFPWLSSYCLQI